MTHRLTPLFRHIVSLLRKAGWLLIHHPTRSLLFIALVVWSAHMLWNYHLMAIQHAAERDLPRFTELPAFQPYRKTFTCKHEADVNPPVSPRAQALFEEALALDDWQIRYKERDYARMAQLYKQAMQLGHWKAQFNLAGLYLASYGPHAIPYNPDEALRLTEDLMRKGIPAAWENMGTYYMSGVGPLAQNATVAYAFWQRAAEMGSARAQAFLGKALDSDIDRGGDTWANRAIGRQLLECAFEQGDGDAAYELGLTYESDARGISDHDAAEAMRAKALNRYHEDVKFGSRDCAIALFVLFDDGDAVVGHAKDPARAARYRAIDERLRLDHNLKLPNLDRVLPLPPAKLPQWDGNVDSLIDAARAVRVTPKPVSLPAHNAEGRAHVPEGHAIFMPPNFTPRQFVGFNGIFSPPGVRMGIVHAPRSGYYQASSVFDHPLTPQENGIDNYAHQQALEGIRPLYYEAGEAMHLRGQVAQDFWFQDDSGHAGILWQFVGEAKKQYVPTDWLANHGTVLPIASATGTFCGEGEVCPQSGIWQTVVTVKDHALYKRFNSGFASEGWRHQSFIVQGEALSSLSAKLGLPQRETPDAAIRWQLMWACERGFDLPERA